MENNIWYQQNYIWSITHNIWLSYMTYDSARNMYSKRTRIHIFVVNFLNSAYKSNKYILQLFWRALLSLWYSSCSPWKSLKLLQLGMTRSVIKSRIGSQCIGQLFVFATAVIFYNSACPCTLNEYLCRVLRHVVRCQLQPGSQQDVPG